MEDSQRAIEWVLAHQDVLSIQVESLSWIESFLPGWHDVHCTFLWNGKIHHTFGAAENPEVSLLKALSEVVERITFLSTDAKSTNGFAAHLDPQLAAEAANRELLERDIFLCHHFLKAPGQPINENINLIQSLQTAWGRLMNSFLDFRVLGGRTVICGIDGRRNPDPYGWILSTALKATVQESIFSAFIESARNAFWIERNEVRAFINKAEFDSLQYPTFRDHGRLALNPNYAGHFDFYFSPPLEGTFGLEYSGTLETIKLDIPPVFRKTSPFHVYQTKSKNLNHLFLSNPTARDVNLDRLTEFAGVLINIKNVNMAPHALD